jgi:hypothetical protein
LGENRRCDEFLDRLAAWNLTAADRVRSQHEHDNGWSAPALFHSILECDITNFNPGCDGGLANPINWKHGGTITYGQFTYHIEPVFDRGYHAGHCSTHFTAYKPDSDKSVWGLAGVTAKDDAQVPKILPPNKFLVDPTRSENLVNFPDGPGKPGPNPFYANWSITVSGSGKTSELQFSLGAQAWSLEDQVVCQVINNLDGGVSRLIPCAVVRKYSSTAELTDIYRLAI